MKVLIGCWALNRPADRMLGAGRIDDWMLVLIVLLSARIADRMLVADRTADRMLSADRFLIGCWALIELLVGCCALIQSPRAARCGS